MRKIKNILIVDDDVVSSYLTTVILEETAVADHIVTVYNGKQALDFLAENWLHESSKPEVFCPACILLDLNMPIMDGFEFLEAIKQQYGSLTDRLWVYVLTTSSAETDRLKASEYPIRGYLTKPLTEENLPSIVNTV